MPMPGPHLSRRTLKILAFALPVVVLVLVTLVALHQESPPSGKSGPRAGAAASFTPGGKEPETAASTNTLASFTCVLVNAANGQFACTLSATTTAALSPQMAVWDLQEANGTTITTLLAGAVKIDKDVTRA